MTTHEKIDQINKDIDSIDGLLNDTCYDAQMPIIVQRRSLRAKLFTLHGYARHTGNGDVLRIDSLPDNLHILFDGHTVAQPIGWYEPATEEQYNDYITKQNSKI